MATGQLTSVMGHLRGALLRHDGGGLTDGQLLEAFLARREEGAFEALVRRHGPMVLAVCRRVLGHAQDAEDAFQATFLVLVRKAASIVPRQLVGNWLYGVAYRTALKARTLGARRRARERQVPTMPRHDAPSDEVWHDLQPLLDQELNRLPEKYRALVVLCDLEGKSRKEAARHLGLAEGTVSSRLARARVILSRRLARHRLTLSAGLLATVLSRQAAGAVVPTTLVMQTVKAATSVAAGQAAAGLISAHVAALSEGVIRAMLWTKLKIATALLLAVGLVGLGLTGLGQSSGADKPAKPRAREDAGAKGDKKGFKKEGKPEVGPELHGVVQAVDAGKGTITVVVGQKGSQQTKSFSVAPKAPVYLEGTNRTKTERPQEGKLADLSAGIGVSLRLSADQKTVLEISARGPSVNGTVKAVDPARGTISVSDKQGDKTYTLAKDVRVSLPSARKGEGEGQPAAVKPGMSVLLHLSVDRKQVQAIDVHRPSLQAAVKSVDPGQHTITVESKGKGGRQEQTLPVARDAFIGFPDRKKNQAGAKLADLKPGMTVSVQLSLDRKTVAAVDVHRPAVFATIKSVDPSQHTITITTKDKKGTQDRTLPVARDVLISIPDRPKGQSAKLADLMPNMAASLQLTVDGKTVVGINVQRPSIHGQVKLVDTAKNTITIRHKDKEGAQEKTFEMAKGLRATVADSKRAEAIKVTDLEEGTGVVAQITLDGKTVVSLVAHGPSLNGVVKGVDGIGRTITFTIKEEGGNFLDKTLDVAKDASISLFDGKTGQQAKLTDLAEGMFVSVRLTLDENTVVSIHARKGT